MICSPAGAHRWSWFILTTSLIWMGVCAIPGSARGQILTVPNEAKSSGDITPYRDALQKFLAAAVAQLTSDSVEAQTKGRQALENETRLTGQAASASAVYLDAYTIFLTSQLQPVVSNPNPRVRLNVAIVTANVAAAADNDHLKGIALALINDKNEAVVLWGIKAAKFIIPAQVRAFGQIDLRLAQAIVPAVKAHSTGVIAGAIAGEAYDALNLDPRQDPTRFPKLNPKAIQTMIPFVLDLLHERVTQYTRGVPPSPQSDAVGARFLTDPKVWPQLTQQQKVDTMQTLANVIGLAGKQAQSANSYDRIALAITVQRTAAAISIILPANAAAAISTAARLSPQAPAAQISAAADTVLPALKGLPDFQTLQDAPAIQGTAPAPPPASAPTTGPVAIPGASAIPPPPPAGGGTTTRPTGPGTRPPGPTGTGTTPRPGGTTPPPPSRPPTPPVPPRTPPGR